jgi:hypothetical protein
MKQWIITVKSLTKNHHFYDKEIAGKYFFHETNERTALDRFHETISIKVLENFDISIKEKSHNNLKLSLLTTPDIDFYIGEDGIPVIHIDTNEYNWLENVNGPICRIYLNDGEIFENPPLSI